MIYPQQKILDHGYVQLVESWGSDERVVEAARMSTNKGFLGWGPVHSPECALYIAREACPHNYGPYFDEAEKTPCTCTTNPGDEKLLRYLYENKHATPFEMGGMVIEVQAPIMVFREWHRHRTQSYNEMSARYTQLPDMFYVPAPERITAQSKKNKQATGTDELPSEIVENFRSDLKATQDESYMRYEWAIKNNVPRELARLHLPVSIYSRMRASANLRNWLSFLTLRMEAGAQWEIRMYANAVAELVAANFPRTYALFAEPRK